MYKKSPEIPVGFDTPTALPRSAEEAQRWQVQNRAWWEKNPMRYDSGSAIGHTEFTPEFYEEIDRRFFASAERYLPSRQRPFDALIPFDTLPSLDVLEIGVGNGSHAALLARHAKSFNGIDLTDYAVRSTTERLRHAGLSGRVQQMDAERMTFPDASFDFIWTWGVIHHSSNTRAILEQMRRVLRPGGKAMVMVYHRSMWDYYVRLGVLRRIRYGWNSAGSLHDIVQLGIDGGLARFYTIPEWESLAGELFTVGPTRIMGQKSEMLPLPGRLGRLAQDVVPDRVTRMLTNTLKLGQFLVSSLSKPH